MTARHVSLPTNYRTADIITWHVRDPLPVSEKWENNTLHKGLMWQGRPACLTLHFQDGQVQAALHTDQGEVAVPQFASMVHNVLGLNQDIERFEHAVRDHPELGPLVQRQQGLRVPIAASPFEALVWAIVGQQISVQAAIAIRRRFVQAVGRTHPGGLWCHPDPAMVAAAPSDTLRAAGLSAAKVHTLHTVSRAIADGTLIWPDTLDSDHAPALQEALMRVRGIGVWTADYTLLRGYGWLDGSLHGDAAVRRSLRTLLQRDASITADDARTWLLPFSPWRALAAAHLWAALRVQA